MRNKQIEEYYFEMFRRDYSLPDGTIEYADKPDVILRGARTIGVEITNFFLQDGHLPESEQVQRKARTAAVAKAQHIYEGRGGGKCEFTFGFDRAAPIRNPGTLAEELANLATSIQPRKTGQLWKDDFRHIPELSFAYLNARHYDDARWRVSQVYEGVMMSPDHLERIVRAKEAKSREYAPCDAYWLLVVVDFINPAQDQEIPDDALGNLTSQVFEKVVIYKTCFGQVVETTP